ncbi:AP-2 complex subunit mu-1 [Purpureocillium lavendulum]|uniref:AP-2 complex subunit mu-1 n=1 Tax=Purpureocillium lavendulum TaxID=1247861 RepID=A0AB34FRJ8_9HYPO|nr:AP-2 complex subunit mu-1 [Purpureocillium lavendulum]
MCQWSLLHHHHIPPCPRPLTSAGHYLYCPDAAVDPSTGEPIAPCLNAVFTPATATADATAAAAAAAATTGGWDEGGVAMAGAAQPRSCPLGKCLVSTRCSTGACRVEDLGGRWACCACGRGGNAYTTCTNRKAGSPDTFCYHNVCATCTPDR